MVPRMYEIPVMQMQYSLLNHKSMEIYL